MARLKRRQLEKQFAQERARPLPSPKQGWIHEIRESLGMTYSQLARRLGIAKQTMGRIEQSEAKGTITVSTIRKVADALDCHVRLVLIPREPLDNLLKKRAREQAGKIVDRTELHMNLEKQGTDSGYREGQIEEIAEELVRTLDRRLWEDEKE